MQQTAAPADAELVSEDLLRAARVFFPDFTAADAIPGHPHLVKIITPAGAGRVRRWPAGVLATDVAFSHNVMATAQEAGDIPVPRLVSSPATPNEPTLRIGQRLFDAQEWLPGATPPRSEAVWPSPDDRIDIPVVLAPAAFSEVMTAAARLHDATTTMSGLDGSPSAPLAMLPGAVRQAHGRHLAAFRARARREPAIQRWLATGERLMAAAKPIFQDMPEDSGLPTSVLHLGLWPAHVLLDGDSLTGLLGWDRIATGSPLLDIAQAIIRLQGWSDEAVEVAIGAYADARPLSPEERRLLPAVAALDAVASTGRLLEQTYAVDETARPPTALRAAIDMMLRSMTALDRSLIAQATVGKSKRTPWRRGPRPTPVRAQEGGKSRARRR